MEMREHAEKLFKKSIDEELSIGFETLDQIVKSIKKLLRDSLSTIDRGCRFKFKEIWLVIEKTAEKGRLIPEKAAEAFGNLEKYFILLYKAPWKKEFRKLKTYCGFFQSKIRSHLEDPESIICLVGFREESPGTLALVGDVDPHMLISVAFECVVATVECEMITEFHRKMKEGGVNVTDVVRWRNTGELPEIKKTHPEDSNSKGFTNSIAIDSAYASANPGASSVRNKSVSAEGGASKNLPFIDEDDHVVDDTGYVEGTIDEHYMASLQYLNKSITGQRRPEVQERSSSDEWSFVRDGLKSKYGPAYYDGVRGDVIRNPREIIRVRNNDDLSDEGIDIGEGPPAVNIQNPPVRIEPLIHKSFTSHARTLTRDSGYRTSTGTSTQVYYPPGDTLSPRHQTQPQSPGATSLNTSAYVSQTSIRSQIPILARGQEYPNMARVSNINQVGNHKPTTPTNRSNTSELMAQKMKVLGLHGPDEWSCVYCTLLNTKHSLVCNGCGKSRDYGPDVDGPQCGDSITVCKKCTYENQPGEMICFMCRNPLDKSNLHTFV